jgi:hypothetical protein
MTPMTLGGDLASGQTFQIGLSNSDFSTETGVLAEIRELGAIFGVGMKRRFDAGSIGLFPVVVFIGPDGGLFHHECFAVGIEFIGHSGKEFNRFCGRNESGQNGNLSILGPA